MRHRVKKPRPRVATSIAERSIAGYPREPTGSATPRRTCAPFPQTRDAENARFPKRCRWNPRRALRGLCPGEWPPAVRDEAVGRRGGCGAHAAGRAGSEPARSNCPAACATSTFAPVAWEGPGEGGPLVCNLEPAFGGPAGACPVREILPRTQ